MAVRSNAPLDAKASEFQKVLVEIIRTQDVMPGFRAYQSLAHALGLKGIKAEGARTTL